jgi:hypothetical protein
MRFVGIAIIACIVGFGSGLLVGRYHPAHNFQKFGESRFILDPATGKVCDPFKDSNASTNIIDQGLTGAKDANGFPIVKPDYPPACGK